MAERTNGKIGRGEAAGLALLLLCLGLCIWRAPYGACGADEALYLSIPRRVMQGDRLLLHEWQVIQLSSLLLLPLLRVYVRLSGGFAGAYLAFRCLFVFFHGLTAAGIYLRLRRFTLPGAVFAAAIYLVFAPINIPSLSYYIMGIGLLSLVLLSFAAGSGGRAEALLCGLGFGMAVLCNPFYFVLYLLYSAAALLFRRRAARPCLSGGYWALFTLGGALVAGYAFAVLFLRADFALLTKTLPFILFTDTEHPARGIPGLAWSVFSCFRKSRFFFPAAGLGAALALLFFLDRKRDGHRPLWLIAACLPGLLFALDFYLRRDPAISVYLFPLSITGFFVWLFTGERRDPFFLFVYLPGAVCWCCSVASSNLGYYTLSAVSAISMLASLVFLGRQLSAMLRGGARCRAAGACLLVSVLLPFCAVTLCRVHTVFPARPAAACTVRLTQGAQRGLVVTPAEKARYDAVLALTEPLRAESDGAAAYFTDVPTMYLDDPKRCGVFSAWFPIHYLDTNLPRLDAYWALFPEKVPARIVVGTGDADSDAKLTAHFAARGYTQTALSPELLLLTKREAPQA